MQVKVKRVGEIKTSLNTPRPGDAGYDLELDEDVSISPGHTRVVSTGVAMEMPDGMAAYVIPRSSMLAKYNIHISTGLIDTSYRGTIKLVMHNVGHETKAFKAGDRVGQAVFFTVVAPEVRYVENLSETNRGSGGFGSTGKSKLADAPKHDKFLAVTKVADVTQADMNLQLKVFAFILGLSVAAVTILAALL